MSIFNSTVHRGLRRTAAVLVSAFLAVPSGITVSAQSFTEDRVDDLISSMSVRDKITQMIMPDFRQWKTAGETELSDMTIVNDEVAQIVSDYHFGAVILFANNVQETEQTFNLTRDLQAAATRNGGLPLLISTDQEGGRVARLGTGTSLPGNMALGADGSSEDAKRAGEIIGSELSALGINTNLSPVVDVNNNPNNPVIGLRSYGDDPTAVGNLASAVIEGMKEYNVIGCAKHFPGHGDTQTDSHYGLPSVAKSREELMNNELRPYQVAISKGIDMIMTAHILYPGLDDSTAFSEKTQKEESLPSTLNKGIITDLLKGELGFQGVVCTDAMNMAGIAAAWSQPQAMAQAMEAGADLICMPVPLTCKADLANLDACINYAIAEHDRGKLTDDRLNDAVRRILTLKEEKGILDYNPASMSAAQANAVVGGIDNRAAEREIAAHAVTVVKNEKNTLPMNLNRNSKVLVFAPNANEPALALMAWNRGKEAGIVPTGAAIDYSVYNKQSALSAEQLAKVQQADYVVAISEVTGANVRSGDWTSAFPNAAMRAAKQAGKKGVIMSASVPYDVQDYDDANAVMAVYGNKGSEADPTETLVGSITSTTATFGPNIIAGMEVALGTFGAQGKLPVSITKIDPKTTQYTDTVVFPRGYGLSYPSKADPNRLPVHRLYNPNTGEHFYTTSENEYRTLVKAGWKNEGLGWIAPAFSKAPVYRLYNSNAGDHHYTMSQDERDALIALGWKNENISWYSADGKTGLPLLRQYNPNAKAGSHNYTLDQNENDTLAGLGWKEEGVAWYALP